MTKLVGGDAHRFLARMAFSDDDGAHLAMAKATSKFKRGNEHLQVRREAETCVDPARSASI